ncbi:MAG: T9SS type A sorting domain-containing protein [Bacteroidetes bacterium]|nr:T9SS type A sorting domain-containing protein [Bacteroidota bacterium]
MKTITFVTLKKIAAIVLIFICIKGNAQENKIFNCQKIYRSDQNDRGNMYSMVNNHLTQFTVYKIVAADIYNFIQQSDKQSKQFSINKDGETLSFNLTSSDLFTPDFVVRVVTDNGIIEQTPPAPSAYKGYVNDNPKNITRTSIRKDYFQAIYLIDNVEYCIQPLSAFTNSGDKDEFVFFKSTDKKNMGTGICDHEIEKKIEPSNGSKEIIQEEKNSDLLPIKNKSDENNKDEFSTASLAWYCSELAFLADKDFYVKAGSSVPATTQRLTDIFNYVLGFYDVLQVSHKISEIVVDATGSTNVTFKSSDPNYGNVYMIDPIQSAFKNWGNTVGNFKNKFDIAVLYTGVDIVSPTVGAGLIGRSTIGGACGTNKYNIIEYYSPWANDYTKHRVDMTHEMGHNYNAAHSCPAANCGYILQPTLSGTETIWDSGTSNSITSFVPSKSPSCFAAGKCAITTDTKEIPKDQNLLIYPNPSNGTFTLSYSGVEKRSAKIIVYNMIGEQIYSKDISLNINKTLDINLSNEAKGSYLVRIVSNDFQLSRLVLVQ